jgi:pyruvate dehydrogenase kinase 2/3/4
MFSEDLKNTPAEHIGSIHTNCKVLEVIQDAYDNAKFLCDQYYLCSPDIDIKVENSKLNLLF